MGRVLKDRPQMTTSAAASTQTSRRFRSENVIIQFNIEMIP
jgi:hypothetical protein